MHGFFDPFCHPLSKSVAKGSRVPLEIAGDDDLSIAGIVTAEDYSVTEGDTVTLTFEDTSIAGVVTASDYSVTEGDTVTLEFDAVTNSYQWIDSNGDNISGETTVETDWVASLTEQPPRIRVTNPSSGKSKIFRVNAPISVAEAPDSIDVTGLPVIAFYDFADPTTVWANTARTTPATVGGTLRAISDKSGNGFHATFATDVVYGNGVADIDQYLTTGNLVVPAVPFARNMTCIIVQDLQSCISVANTTTYLWNDSSGAGAYTQFPDVYFGSGVTIGEVPPCGMSVMAIRGTASGVSAWINGRTKATAGAYPSNYQFLSDMTMPGYQPGAFNFSQTKIRAVILCDGTMTDQQIEDLIVHIESVVPNTNVDTGEKILVFGDSIASGATLRDNWPSMVARQASTPVRVYNSSTSGALAWFGVNPYTTFVPDKVILSRATNDIFGGRTLQQCKDAITAWETGVGSSKLYVQTVLPRTSFDAGQESIRTDLNSWIISTYGAKSMNVNLAGLVSGDYYDGTHPNLVGQQKLADYYLAFFGL